MDILQTAGWEDYALLDSGNGKRLERFGAVILDRPDPQALWHPRQPEELWQSAHAVFTASDDEQQKKESWRIIKELPKPWHIHWNKFTVSLRLTPFKHTGIFPEQHVQWQWMQDTIHASQQSAPRVLNLFAYTGMASLVCAASGAHVTHVDASKPSMTWARENQALSRVSDTAIRWILDDALSFVSREARRGQTYDAIIMDPPVYGHGPQGQLWDFPQSFPQLIEECTKVLVPHPLFILI
ncbi:MAG: class I SAM-dependent methyltransferase, partial [Candidatus Roizmanbacteria bacterium]|nr:class I SAM-dependent methyltransferase [Candidatus Roizmanbacteria bacterium]